MEKTSKTQVFYQIFTRNFTSSGDFQGIIKHLDYLSTLGATCLYLMPINTIGKVGRKGRLGSPYSIKDYYEINPEYGTLEDFKNLISLTHEKNMKVMIDIVFNHTSRDSYISKAHPSWMYKNKEGKMANKVGEWTDVYDLDLSKKPLRKYLIDIIDFYSSLGIDGYRFDVCSLLPKDFYVKLFKMLNEKYPETIMLGEAVDTNFANAMRKEGFNVLSDGELYELGFTFLYQYDSFPLLKQYLETGNWRHIEQYKAAILRESAANPQYYLKIRGIENHDQKRIIEYSEDRVLMKNLFAFNALMKGPLFLYNGIETKSNHTLNLFAKDEMDWSIDWEWYKFVKLIIDLKRDQKEENLNFTEIKNDEGLYISYINHYSDGTKRFGLFNLSFQNQFMDTSHIPSGKYKNLLDDSEIEIKDDKVFGRDPLYLELIEEY